MSKSRKVLIAFVTAISLGITGAVGSSLVQKGVVYAEESTSGDGNNEVPKDNPSTPPTPTPTPTTSPNAGGTDTSIVLSLKPSDPPNSSGWYDANRLKNDIFLFVNANSMMSKYKYKINDGDFIEVDDLNSSMVSIPVEKVNGKREYTVMAMKQGGTEWSKEFKHTFKLDNSIPYYKDIQSGEAIREEGILYYLNSSAQFDVLVHENESGINNVYLKSSNSGVMWSKVNFHRDGEYAVYTFSISMIPEGSTWDLRMEDVAGNVNTNYKFFTTKKESGINTADIDTSAIGERVTVTDKDNKEITWHKGDGIIKFKRGFDLGKETVIVDGKEYKGLTHPDSITTVLDTRDIPQPEGVLNVVYKAQRGMKNVTKEETIYWDKEAPKISAKVNGNFIKDGKYSYTKENPIVKFGVSDKGSGVAKVELLNSLNGKLENRLDVTGKKEVSLKWNGDYTLVVTDKVGLSATLPLKAISDMENLIIDTTPPVVKINTNLKDGTWLKDDEDIKLEASDKEMLNKVEVFVNGKKVKEALKPGTSWKDTINTGKLVTNSKGEIRIKVTGSDIVGNTVSDEILVRVDKGIPTVDGFTFVDPGYKEGVSIQGGKDYGFFFKNKVTVQVKVSDPEPSSGIKEISWRYDGNKSNKGVAKVDSGIATFEVPEDFKGHIYATVKDNVGNVSKEGSPSGVITESANWSVQTTKLDIILPSTNSKGSNNEPAYSKAVEAQLKLQNGVSGIRKIKWGIGDKVIKESEVSLAGNIDGWRVVSKDLNLVTLLEGVLPLDGNTNNMKVWVESTDRAGYTSKLVKEFTIDKDAPLVDVSYNRTESSKYYNSSRFATVRIKERNFDSRLVRFSGKVGSVGEWRQAGDGVWTTTVNFNQEGTYQWNLNVTDKVGNVGKSYSSEDFTVDTTSPVVSLNFSGGNPENGMYYKSGRSGILTVTEVNFDPSLIAVSGANVGGWTHNGSVHTAYLGFTSDGEYQVRVAGRDRAGNQMNSIDSGRFIIDTTVPTAEISGVQNGVSYKKQLEGIFSGSDRNIDSSRTSMKVVGRRTGEHKLKGGISGRNAHWVIENLPEVLDSDDFYTATLVMYDMAGNSKEVKAEFSVNRFGSQYNFKGVEEYKGKYLQELPKDLLITESSVDKLDMKKAKVVVLKDGNEITIPVGAWKVTESGGKTGNWVYTYAINKDAFTEDGKYQVQIFSVNAVDGSKSSSLSQEFSFVVDHTKPEVLITGVVNDGVYHSENRKVIIDIRDTSGVDSIKVELNSRVVEATNLRDGVYELIIPSSSETYNLKVDVVDKAGNTNSSEVKDFFINESILLAMWHYTWVKALVISVGVLLAVLLGWLLLAWRRRRKEEKLREAYQESAVIASRGSASGSAGSSEENTTTTMM